LALISCMPKNFILKIFALSEMDGILYSNGGRYFGRSVICPDTEIPTYLFITSLSIILFKIEIYLFNIS